jgi:NAD(P)-dependent dehydrogenase (short-subunit alcohol dehydrogenase family)
MRAAGFLFAGVVLVLCGATTASGAPPSSGKTAGAPTVLITGASRGIGLEFARYYAAQGWNVIATARNPAEARGLQELARERGNVRVEALDVTNHAQIDALAARLRGTPIDVLLNNAAISAGLQNEAFGRFRYDLFEEVLRTNTIAPLKMAEAFVEHVAASGQKKIVTVTSSQGSIGELRDGMTYFYRSSKTAVNMLMANLAIDMRPRGIVVGLVTPGATDTDLLKGVPIPKRPAAEAARTMAERIEAMTLADSGKFLNWDGKVIPW